MFNIEQCQSWHDSHPRANSGNLNFEQTYTRILEKRLSSLSVGLTVPAAQHSRIAINWQPLQLNTAKKVCLFCSLYFSMALQFFLFSLLVLNMCWRSESVPQCRMADWWAAFDRKGWATCDFSNQYIKGLWRNHNGGPREKIYLLEQAKCCFPPKSYLRALPICKTANWWAVLDRWVCIGFDITSSKFKLKNCRYSWALLSWSTRAAKN